MKIFKVFLLFLFSLLLLISYIILTFSQTNFEQETVTLEIKKANYNVVIEQLKKNNCLAHPDLFKFIYKLFFKNKTLKSSRYTIKNGMNTFKIIYLLTTGNNAQVKLTIKKLRTKNDLIKLLTAKLNIDSAEINNFINNNDSLNLFEVDTNLFFTLIIPNTYYLYWNTNIKEVLTKLAKYQKLIRDSIEKSPVFNEKKISFNQLYILASIVEEESNIPEDKIKIAGVYLNRLKSDMPLQADPTIKYAVGDFSLKRILYTHLKINSEYNTYQKKGLPIGPICTPSLNTLMNVANASEHNFYFFVSAPNLSGKSIFSHSFNEHKKNVREFHRFINKLTKSK